MADKIIQPHPKFKNPHIPDMQTYQEMYQESITNPKRFFGKEAEENLSWFQKFSSVHNDQFENTKWFNGGLINVSHNCIDRHLDKHSEKTALIWEGDDPQDNKMISYQELYEQVCQFANILKKLNVKKGTRVCIYMPMIPEAAFAMLACTRIGAIHSVVFGGFSPESLKDRILDSDCRIVITADEGVRGGKKVPLKANVDKALMQCPNVTNVVVVQRTQGHIAWHEGRAVSYTHLTLPTT